VAFGSSPQRVLHGGGFFTAEGAEAAEENHTTHQQNRNSLELILDFLRVLCVLCGE
jgi:hypothetical protein